MYYRGECSRHNDRFITQFHENLVQVTYVHFNKQNESFKKRVDDQKLQNNAIRQRIRERLDDNKVCKKEVEKYKNLNFSRADDYGKIKVAIENELEELESKLQEASLRNELKEGKIRELEVETDNDNNKLSAESQKLVIIEEKLEFMNIKIKNLEETIRNDKIKVQKFEQDLELRKNKNDRANDQLKQTQKKYDMSKDFIETINKINDDYIHSMELLNREKRSLYFSKALHEKFNTRLINIIVMHNIPHNAATLRDMMSKLDTLNNKLIEIGRKANVLMNCIEAIHPSLEVNAAPIKEKSKRRRKSKSCRPDNVEINMKDVNVSERHRTPGDLCDSEVCSRLKDSADIELLYRNAKSNSMFCSDYSQQTFEY